MFNLINLGINLKDYLTSEQMICFNSIYNSSFLTSTMTTIEEKTRNSVEQLSNLVKGEDCLVKLLPNQAILLGGSK